MALRMKVDEDLPADVADLLRQAGHDAVTVREEELSGVADDMLWQVAQEEKRCLVTADRGFANAQLYPPGRHAGIVLLRLPRESRRGYVELVKSLLARVDFESTIGAIVVVSPGAVRFHRSD